MQVISKLFDSRLFLRALLIVPVLLVPGCFGKKWQATLQPAHGTCLVNGLPATSAIVLLFPKSGNIDVRESKPWGVVDDKGEYRLSTYQSGDGIPIGDYDVTLVWLADRSQPKSADRLRDRYSDPKKPLMSISIQEGENTLPLIDLKESKLLPSSHSADVPKDLTAGSQK